MDCKTARLLLAFARPQTGEMEEADARDLEHHLDQCPACAAAARGERRLDQHLGKAMRQVEVPSGMRAAILGRLTSECSQARRRWLVRTTRYAVAAAALVAILAGGWHWWASRPAVLDLDALWARQNRVDPDRKDPPAEITAYFRRQGLNVQAPQELNYHLLTAYGLTDLQGRQVPQLVFVRTDGPPEQAQVYLVSDRQFDLQALEGAAGSNSGQYKVSVIHQPGERQAMVIVHTGDLTWLMNAPQQAA